MTALRQRQPRVLCPGYLAWLRRQGCCCGCGSPAPSDAAHIRSGSIRHGKPYTGMQEKPSDCWALPLRHDHHMAQHNHGDEVGWYSAHGIEPFMLSMEYFEEYSSQADAKAEIKERRSAQRSKSIRKKAWPKRKFRSMK